MKKFLSILSISIFQIICLNVFAQPSFTVSTFSSGFSSITEITHCNDSRLFVAQQRGLIRIVDSTGAIRPTPFLNLTGTVSGSGPERGLLGLAFHPNYKQNGYFYVNYTTTASPGQTVIARYSVNPNDSNLALPNSGQILLSINQPYSNHNGGCLRFGKDGYLYVGMGDGGSGGDPQNYSQTNSSLLGKMLRIDINSGSTYVVPSSNPFVGNSAYAPEIWATGVRNPWKYSFDRITGDMWMGDVGQNAWEEVNFQPANSPGGENYGWRCYEGNTTYNTSGCASASNYDFPVFVYDHGSQGGLSITGGYVYRGAQYNNLFGYYFCTDYVSGRVWWIKRNDNNTFSNGVVGVFNTNSYTSWGEDYLGELYLARDSAGNNDRIQKLNVNNPTPVAYILSDTVVQLCPGVVSRIVALRGRNLNYQWQKDGINISGANNYWLDVTEAGEYRVVVSNSSGNSSISSQTVEVLPEPNVQIAILEGQEPITTCETCIVLNATAGLDNYSWSNGITTPENNICTNGFYSVCTSNSGCLICSDDIEINVLFEPQLIISGYQSTYNPNSEPDTLIANLPNVVFTVNGVPTNIIDPANLTEGEFIINAEYTDNDSCFASFSDTLLFDLNTSLIVNYDDKLTFYPNPLSGNKVLNITNTSNSGFIIEIYASNGALIKRHQQNQKTGVIDLSSLSGGIYLIRSILPNGNSNAQKLIIND